MLEKGFRISDPIIVCQSCTGTIDNALHTHLNEKSYLKGRFKYHWDKHFALILKVSAEHAEEIKKLILAAAAEVGFFVDSHWEEIENPSDTPATDKISSLSTSSSSSDNSITAVNITTSLPTPSSANNSTAPKPKAGIKDHFFKGLLATLVGVIWICKDFFPMNNLFWLIFFLMR